MDASALICCYSCRPYAGLFIPYQQPWVSEGAPGIVPPSNVSYALMDEAFEATSAAGFRSLAYFDVTHWGANVVLPPPANTTPIVCGSTTDFPAPCPTVQASSGYLQVCACGCGCGCGCGWCRIGVFAVALQGEPLHI